MTLAEAAPPDAGIAVCIDDLGLHPGITEAALHLGTAGRVSALAGLTDAPGWRQAASAVRRVLHDRVDFGLHLNFTEPWSLTPFRRPLTRFIASAYAHALDRALLRDDVRRQLDGFEDAVGAMPDFIDGHRHVHQLPQVREALLSELTDRYPLRKPWLRNTEPPRRPWTAPMDADHRKQVFVAALGARPLRTLADSRGFVQNGHLLGVYAFAGNVADYAMRWRQWSMEASNGDLLVCHAASAAGASADPIAMARTTEFAALSDPTAAWDTLEERGLRIVRLSRHGDRDVGPLGRRAVVTRL